MKFGKKQLVLASLVLALGAAVYLNWQFAGTNRLPVGESSEESSQLGAAQLVNNAYVETVNDGLEANASSESGESGALSQALLGRQGPRRGRGNSRTAGSASPSPLRLESSPPARGTVPSRP